MIAVYFKLTADVLGEIKGPVRDRDTARNGSISLIAIEHDIGSPRDLATGLATGKRVHHPIVVTKATDNTSPLFNQMIARNELIKTAEFLFFGTDSQGGFAAGRETLQYRISLTKAFVARVELVGRLDPAAQDNNRFPVTERISLVYDTIQWEWPATKVSAHDNFSAVSSS